MYGKELVLDLHKCNVSSFNRNSIERYFVKLCTLIDMKREALHFWDDEGLPPEECQTDPKTTGISAVQFILTSSIVIHALMMLGNIYVNVFSCKEFDEDTVLDFTVDWFDAQEWHSKVLERK